MSIKITEEEIIALLEQAARDLNQAHNEILRLQGREDFDRYDWPEWSPQANTIRSIERIVGRRLAKTNIWTEFPVRSCLDCGGTGEITIEGPDCYSCNGTGIGEDE